MSEDPGSEPVELGDGRQKHITLVQSDGERIEYEASYLRHSTDEFIVSSDESFPESEMTRYPKREIDRIDVDQHHSRCFITTTVADDPTALQPLRGFRDRALTRSSLGRSLVGLYETVSPPIAETLARYPNARVTQAVGTLVRCCARIADRRAVASSSTGRGFLSLLLVGLYLLGVGVGAGGHLGLQVYETVNLSCR